MRDLAAQRFKALLVAVSAATGAAALRAPLPYASRYGPTRVAPSERDVARWASGDMIM